MGIGYFRQRKSALGELLQTSRLRCGSNDWSSVAARQVSAACRRTLRSKSGGDVCGYSICVSRFFALLAGPGCTGNADVMTEAAKK